MNTNNVKKYAPKARKTFIEAMSKQAAKYGISNKKIEPAEQKGDLVLIGDRPFPASIIKPRERLVKRIEQQGFDQVMEHVAYSWFNRLCAIRYMERKGFLDHGRRVLSAADGSAGVPQILEECLDVELPGLDQAKIRGLKLDGNKDEELYRELLLAQCHALHQAMPFLFETVADETELLLPENLTKTDSLIRDLVASVPDEDWDQIEIIGWLYQFYISEKKDQVMGTVVKSEDIPAATQLFTPNWIVQYLVQNSVGRHWLQTYPDSPLKEKMPYYIEPTEQTPDVLRHISAIAPSEIFPEQLTCIDVACGSGHILVEAYKVFKAIYEERGYRSRDIPKLILENNLFGLDIDDRAGQLAGFALMMLARNDDRRIFSREIKLNVLSLKESSSVNLPQLWHSLNLNGEWQAGASQSLFDEDQLDVRAFQTDIRYQLLERVLDLFTQAKTFGSLIEVSHEDQDVLKGMSNALHELISLGDLLQRSAAEALIPYVQQAYLLAKRYDAVVANPPYMGSNSMNMTIKTYINTAYPNSKSDLFSVFMDRAFYLLKTTGFNAQINMQSWMFLASFSKLRENLLTSRTLIVMAHLGARAFSQISGEIVQTTAFIFSNNYVKGYQPSFLRLVDGDENVKKANLLSPSRLIYSKCQELFRKIPGSPIVYWAPENATKLFDGSLLGNSVFSSGSVKTGNNELYIRCHWEVYRDRVGPNNLWRLHPRGGEYRKWYGNVTEVVNWSTKARSHYRSNKIARIPEDQYWDLEGICWSEITTSNPAFRLLSKEDIANNKSLTIYPKSHDDLFPILGFLNTNVANELLYYLNPTIGFGVGDILRLPWSLERHLHETVSEHVRALIDVSKSDWDKFEDSFEYVADPLVTISSLSATESFDDLFSNIDKTIHSAKNLEEKINSLYLSALGLESDFSVNVPIENISLRTNRFYAFGNKYSVNELYNRQRSRAFCNLISFAIGCMMGRYSLDKPGVVYAHSSDDYLRELLTNGAYISFPPDSDGIIPLTDVEWFPDDSTNMFQRFVDVLWEDSNTEVNLQYIADSLTLHAIKPKLSESPADTIRRYFSSRFYKDHLDTYRKRPIYWLFSSGKYKAFECLVYLHRYTDGTLSRMRTEYVIPLTSKLATYVKRLENDRDLSTSTSEIKRLENELTTLHRQQAELSEFDEKLRHYADQRIRLDLDEGVKVNYGKFGDLLAEVKAITGKAPEALS